VLKRSEKERETLRQANQRTDVTTPPISITMSTSGIVWWERKWARFHASQPRLKGVCVCVCSAKRLQQPQNTLKTLFFQTRNTER